MTQKQANDLWENVALMMPKRYSMILILFLLTLGVSPFMPGLCLISVAGLFFMDWTMRYILLRRATFTIQIGHELAVMLASALPFANLLYSIMNLFYFRNIQGNWSLVMIIAVVISSINIFLPIRRVVDYFFVPEA